MIFDMKVDTEESTIFMLGEDKSLFVFDLNKQKTIRTLKLSHVHVKTFVLYSMRSPSLLYNSDITGLMRLDLKSGQSEALGTKVLNFMGNTQFAVDAKKQVVFGKNKEFQAVSVSLHRGFKTRLLKQGSRHFEMICLALCQNPKTVFVGTWDQRVLSIDTRSWKLLFKFGFVGPEMVTFLEVRNDLVFGLLNYGDLFVIENRWPFALKFHRKAYPLVFRICFTERFLIVSREKASKSLFFVNPMLNPEQQREIVQNNSVRESHTSSSPSQSFCRLF